MIIFNLKSHILGFKIGYTFHNGSDELHKEGRNFEE
jgi:hypothetical protein